MRAEYRLMLHTNLRLRCAVQQVPLENTRRAIAHLRLLRMASNLGFLVVVPSMMSSVGTCMATKPVGLAAAGSVCNAHKAPGSSAESCLLNGYGNKTITHSALPQDAQKFRRRRFARGLCSQRVDRECKLRHDRGAACSSL